MGTKHRKHELFIEFGCSYCNIAKQSELSARRPMDILSALTCEKCGMRMGKVWIQNLSEEGQDNPPQGEKDGE